MTGPDNPLARPLTRAEEIALWGDDDAALAAQDRTLDALTGADPMGELEIGAYGPEKPEHGALNELLRLAASRHTDDAELAAAARAVVAAIVERCNARYWDNVDEHERLAMSGRIERAARERAKAVAAAAVGMPEK